VLKLILLNLIFSAISIASSINVAVAANVTYAMDELKIEFAKLHPSTKVRVIIGSSGKLSTQIQHGAPYDVFLSANMEFPKVLYKNKTAITKPLVYAQGNLIYFSTKKQDFKNGIYFLKSDKISKIAMGNPKTAPYGKATYDAMQSAGIYDAIKSKLVYGESISQTLSFAITTVDVGIIAKSAVYSKKMLQYKSGVNYADVSSELYKPINQGAVLLRNAKDNLEAKLFYDFIFSNKAKEIFVKYGYGVL